MRPPKGPKNISAAKPGRTRNEGPTIWALAHRMALLGGTIKEGAGGILRLTGISTIGHNETAGGSPLAYYAHIKAITETQRQAGERYAMLQYRLYGRELKVPSIYDRMVTDEALESHPPRLTGIPCGTYCGDACDCPAADWMADAKTYAEADNHLRRVCRPITRLILRRACFDDEWLSWAQVLRLRYGLGQLVVHWRM